MVATIQTLGHNSYGVNWNELKSHSSFVQNERLHYLLGELDQASKFMNETYHPVYIKRTKSVLFQIWKNVQPLVVNNPWCRQQLALNTKIPGLYSVDVAFSEVDKMIIYCEIYSSFTFKTNYMITTHLNRIEMTIRNILQYFHYLFRPAFKQKPDIVEASQEFKKMADKLTIEQLQQIAGPKNTIGFNPIQAEGQSESEMVDEIEDIIEEEDSD